MSKVLIVEDEKAISDILAFNLKRGGYQVVCAYDGSEAVDTAEREKPDLVLLDVMLPKLGGYEVCKKIRLTSTVPIIMLTAREDENDKVRGLESGADDYVTKPFSMRELLARVHANMRRQDTYQVAPVAEHGPVLRAGRLVLDTVAMEVTCAEAVVQLTPREYELLLFLFSQPGKVFTREQLMQQVWDYEYFGDLRTVDVTIRRLREKIESSPAEPEYIMTRRGTGYYFSARAQSDQAE